VLARLHARYRRAVVDRDAPSVRERRLARELRQLRTGEQLHAKDVAARLGWSPSKVSRIETARIGITAEDLDRLLDLYRVPDGQADLLRRLAPSARPRGWWDAYADTLSAGYANLIRLEAGSRALRCFGALVPHALLQTPDYVRQVVLSTWERPSPPEVDRRVQVCRRRQEVLDAADPMQLWAVLDESVLRRAAGAPGRQTAGRCCAGSWTGWSRWPDGRRSRCRCCPSTRVCRR